MLPASWPYFILAIKGFDVKVILSLTGRSGGALLLLYTPPILFAGLVPTLILFATAVFALGNFASLETIQRIKTSRRASMLALFAIAIYGGYFGGGTGFLMLAAFTLFGMRDINAMNGLKLALVGVMGVSAIVQQSGHSTSISDWSKGLSSRLVLG